MLVEYWKQTNVEILNFEIARLFEFRNINYVNLNFENLDFEIPISEILKTRKSSCCCCCFFESQTVCVYFSFVLCELLHVGFCFFV